MSTIRAISSTVRSLLALVGVSVIVGASCGSGTEGRDRSPATSAIDGDITVFAAASLAGAFTAIGEAFEAEHADATVTFSFDGSSRLARQIVEGAPADVFASADTVTMDELVSEELVTAGPVVFATNALAIIVEAGNPGGITGLADLAGPDVTTVVCAPEVPCGRYAAAIFAAAGVDVTPASLEQSVRGVAAKVTTGEADAGIVYVTDVVAAGEGADIVEIPSDVNVVADYPAASVASSDEPDVARAFVEFLQREPAQAILAEHGFGPP